MGLAGCATILVCRVLDGGCSFTLLVQALLPSLLGKNVQMPQISHMLLRPLERCEPRIALATLTAILQHPAGVRLTLSTGRPSRAPALLSVHGAGGGGAGGPEQTPQLRRQFSRIQPGFRSHSPLAAQSGQY